jgi:hypothetical protein
VNLRGAVLSGARLVRADCSGSTFASANLSEADLTRADLSGTLLAGARLTAATLLDARLGAADLSGTDLTLATLTEATLAGATLAGSVVGFTVFANTDFRGARGLDTIEHRGPSTVGIDTLYRSADELPDAFLHGCGVPDDAVAWAGRKRRPRAASRYYSCFISYSGADEAFARRLHARLAREHVRVWFAPADVRGGEKLRAQLDTAIEGQDRLLVVLSASSFASPWVVRAVGHAYRLQQEGRGQKLFPVRLVPYERFPGVWRDPDTTVDLVPELQQYFIPDFSTGRTTPPSRRRSPDSCAT